MTGMPRAPQPNAWPRLPLWAGALWASLWGGALVLPSFVGLGEAHHPVWCAVGLVVAFGLFVVTTVDATARAGARRADLWPVVLLLAVVCAALVADGGVPWGTLPILVAVAVGTSTPLRWAPWLVVPLAAAAALVDGFRSGAWDSAIWGTGLVTLLAGLLTCAFGWLASVIGELRATRRELALTAVSAERLRFARDLHDLLGHSMSVISVKAQAARRYVHTDPDAAERHTADIESLAQQALAEVREAVHGYRSTDLDLELTRAAQALRSAGIDTLVVRDDDDLTPDQQDLLAWVVREGATNVLRHAHASHAVIRTSSAGGRATLVIEDDGSGSADVAAVAPHGGSVPAGTGLAGLRDRLTRAGGTLATTAAASGFRLTAEVPAKEAR